MREGDSESTLGISEFDAILSQGRPFGDSSYIHEQMQGAFTRRIDEISPKFPVGRRLLASLRQADPEWKYLVLGDPVVRGAIQQALWQISTGKRMALPLEQCGQVLSEAVRHLDARLAPRSPLAPEAVPAPRLRSTSSTPWIWTDQRAAVLAPYFQQLVEHEYGGWLCTPTVDEVEILQKAARLLDDISPLLARSALSHTHVIAVFPAIGNWATVASSSQFRLTGVIFLNRTTFKNPWWLAEHLLHESLHQKLYDFRHAHSLLTRDDPNEANHPSNAGTVVSLWNTPGLDASNCWDPHRAIAAFHVYVHLALFCTLAERRAPELEGEYGRIDAPPAMTGSRKAFERAHYLADNLRWSCWDELGLAGQRLVEWLNSVLNALDPSPPPPGSYLHLILDRYLKEAGKVQKRLPSRNLASRLAALIRAEITSAQALLDTAGTQTNAGDFLTRFAQDRDLDDNVAFLEARRTIAETLRRLAPDGYSIKPSAGWTAARTPDETVREMIDTSSHELAAMGAI